MKKNLLRLLALFVLALTAAHAADDKLNAAVRAADDERVAATKAGDRKRLEAIYSKDLHYAHSSGKIDTQASYIDSLVKRTTIYEKYDYQTREFRPAGPRHLPHDRPRAHQRHCQRPKDFQRSQHPRRVARRAGQVALPRVAVVQESAGGCGGGGEKIIVVLRTYPNNP